MGGVSAGIGNGGCQRVWCSFLNIPLGQVFRTEVGQEEGLLDLRAELLHLHPDR